MIFPTRLRSAMGMSRQMVRWGFVALIVAPSLAWAEPKIEDAQQLFLKGDYAGVITAAGQAHPPANDPEWPLLQAAALTETGHYPEARAVLGKAVGTSPLSIRLRLAFYEALRRVGALDIAKRQLDELDKLAGMRAWAYRTLPDRVALARVALLLGNDPKKVIDLYLDPLRKLAPDFRETWLVNGNLALDKNDFALAAKTFAAATKAFPQDPDMWFGLARAYAPSEPETMVEAVNQALKFNPRHIGAHLLLADHAIDAEDYAQADAELKAVLDVDPHRPEAHAYRAVLANLRADAKSEATARDEALKFWPKNPAVPYLIGRKLSQKYRFAEGAARQREALQWEPAYLPSKGQLANDLLRLGGHDDEAWALADEVQKADPYDVVAYNLTSLHEAIANFQILNSEHFTVKMDPHEATTYGADVLKLLERAHETLTRKYGLQLKDKTIVEIFPDQKDFAIRTFGLPGGAGYLGVCFGRVITANSPASRPNSPNSWEAVLWHEFCHVVTLTLTKNKMPRWLSEGISVYEERQARGNWGEQMKPRYRAMILGEDLTPVSQLSGAFLRPKSGIHLGFAYYESSLAVQWLTERWGLDKMKALLGDLAKGVEINAALAAQFEPIEKLDQEFAAHAQELAKGTGSKLDWTTPDAKALAGGKSFDEFLTSHPDNVAALTEQAKDLIAARKWAEAKGPLQKLIERYPDQHGRDSAYALLAEVHRGLGEAEAEVAMLNKVVELSSDATDAFQRLMEISSVKKDWPGVLANAARYDAVDPLSPFSHHAAAQAHEALGEKPAAIIAYRTLLTLNPPDPAEIHYRLALLLHATGDTAAKREVLLALEDAPRFQAALQLLLAIDEPSAQSPVPPAAGKKP